MSCDTVTPTPYVTWPRGMPRDIVTPITANCGFVVFVPHAQVVSMSVSRRDRVLLFSKPLEPLVPCFAPCLAPWGPSCLSVIDSLLSLPAALLNAASVTVVCALLGKYLNRQSFRENLCGSPSGDTKQAFLPAADHVHPWDSLVGSDTRVRLDHGTIIARVNPRAPLKVRSPTLLTALAPPAVNSWMGLNSVRTLVARGVCRSPIMSCVAPISKITECPSVCVPPPCATPVLAVSKVVGLLGCGGPKCPLLWACSFFLACSVAAF